MPRKSDSIPINNAKLDKRVKLTDESRQQIKEEYETGDISIHSLSKKYKVSRRTIQFILFPDRLDKAKEQFAERRKDGRYYDKDKHREYTKQHRDHKKELWNKGLLEKENNDLERE
jgi:hypothetical protein